MLHVGQLPVVHRQDALDGVHQQLQGLAAGVQLLVPLLLGRLLVDQLLAQLLLGTHQPISSADGQDQGGALRKRRNGVTRTGYYFKRVAMSSFILHIHKSELC